MIQHIQHSPIQRKVCTTRLYNTLIQHANRKNRNFQKSGKYFFNVSYNTKNATRKYNTESITQKKTQKYNTKIQHVNTTHIQHLHVYTMQAIQHIIQHTYNMDVSIQHINTSF